MLAADYPFLDVLWTMCIFFLFFIWIWLLITVFADIFRRRDIGGGMKTLWCIFVILLPYLGVFIYLIAEHEGMAERNDRQMQTEQQATDAYIKSVAGGGGADGRDREGEGTPRFGCDHAVRIRHHQAKCAGRRVTRRRSRPLVRRARRQSPRPAHVGIT